MDVGYEELLVHLDMHTMSVDMVVVRCKCGGWVEERGPGVKNSHNQHVVDSLWEARSRA